MKTDSRAILYIGNALAKHGESPSSADIVPNLFRNAGMEVVVSSSKSNQVMRMLDMLMSIIKSFRSIDYVLIDTYSTRNFWYAYFCSQLCRLLRLSYIPILHGGSLPKRMDHSALFSKAIFGNSYRNVVPSGYLLKALKDRGYSAELIPNSIPIKKYQFKRRKEISPRLLYVRAFAGLYNPQMAVRVLRALLVDHPDAELCMVGPDKDGTLEECEALARKLNVEDKVTFTGRLSKAAWHELSEGYDVFINTTNKDNTPVSVIEAMALGLPVVSTNPGGVPYLIDDGEDGLLVGLNDVEAMVEKIAFLINNAHQAIAVANSARIKVGGFDWDSVKLLWRKIL